MLGTSNRHYIGKYTGRCIGRVCNAFCYYAGSRGDECQYNSDTVSYGGETLATYEFIKNTDIPYFKFNETIWFDQKTAEKNQAVLHHFLEEKYDKLYIDDDLLYLTQEYLWERMNLDQITQFLNSRKKTINKEHLQAFDELIEKFKIVIQQLPKEYK